MDASTREQWIMWSVCPQIALESHAPASNLHLRQDSKLYLLAFPAKVTSFARPGTLLGGGPKVASKKVIEAVNLVAGRGLWPPGEVVPRRNEIRGSSESPQICLGATFLLLLVTPSP